MEKPFSAYNISMLIQDIILKNGWCYSIPGLLKMLKRPIFSYSEIGYISAVSSWIIFLSQSFTHCLQMRLSLCLNSSLLWGWCLCCFRRDHSYSQRTRMKKGTNVSVRVTETGGKVGDKLCHMKHYICKAACGITASMPPWHTSRMTFWSQCVCGGGVRGIQHHPPTSQLWKQNFILTLRGGVEIGDNKASEGRNYSLVLIVGLQEGGWR